MNFGQSKVKECLLQTKDGHPVKTDGEARVGCFALIILLMSCDSKCSVALPPGAMVWSVVCDCGISRPYSLAFLVFL